MAVAIGVWPRKNAGRFDAGLEERHRAIAHIGEIFVQVPDDIGRVPERRQNVHEPEHLDLEMFVAHRERHHALVRPGLAENRLRVLIDEIEDLQSALFDLLLQRTHCAILAPGVCLGKELPCRILVVATAL